MFTFPTPAALMASLLFSGLGFIAFSYGRTTQRHRLLVGGLVLMVYPYFFDQAWIVVALGATICAAMYWFRD